MFDLINFLKKHNLAHSDARTIACTIDMYEDGWASEDLKGEAHKGIVKLKTTKSNPLDDELWDKRILFRKVGDEWQWCIWHRKDVYTIPVHRLPWQPIE